MNTTSQIPEKAGLNDAFYKVQHFHRTFGQPAPDAPILMPLTRAAKRAEWMRDEIKEFLDASVNHDLVGQADGMIDLIYFAIGTLVEIGIPPQELFDIVQDANMAKLHEDGKPHFREDGKIIKPANWQPPEPLLRAVIIRLIEADMEKNKQLKLDEVPHVHTD